MGKITGNYIPAGREVIHQHRVDAVTAADVEGAQNIHIMAGFQAHGVHCDLLPVVRPLHGFDGCLVADPDRSAVGEAAFHIPQLEPGACLTDSVQIKGYDINHAVQADGYLAPIR